MYGFHFDHHTLSIARDGELLATEPLAVETATSDPRFGRAALAAARGRPDEVSLSHWRELSSNANAARNDSCTVAMTSPSWLPYLPIWMRARSQCCAVH